MLGLQYVENAVLPPESACCSIEDRTIEYKSLRSCSLNKSDKNYIVNDSFFFLSKTLKGSPLDLYKGSLHIAVMLTLCHMASLLCVLKLAKPPQEKLIRFCSPHCHPRGNFRPLNLHCNINHEKEISTYVHNTYPRKCNKIYIVLKVILDQKNKGILGVFSY